MDTKTIPQAVELKAEHLGERIRAARTRRGLRREDLAAKAGVSRSTLEKVERGDLGAAFGAYLRSLWALGLDAELDLVADPGLDRDGLALELNSQTKRVRVQVPTNNDF
jgi:transcriptional regulator with XRE-family HTH domain